MDLRLLGPLEARVEGRPIELGPRQQRAVLAMLALELGRPVSADRLAEGLWGETPPASAQKMVQLYVSRLRRALDGDGATIVTRDRGYELQLPSEAVDAVRFERLVDSHPREALALWHGAALAEFADESFAAADIRRLEELRLRASELAIDADLAAGRHAEVIGELDALTTEEPLREHLHAQRMLALYRSGRQADALEAYRDARAALVEQIGVEPGAELRRLQDEILAQAPALDLPAVAEPEAPAHRASPSRRLLVIAAAALLLAGVTAFGVIRVLAPDSLPGIDENAVGLIDPDNGRITTEYRVGHGPQVVAAGAGSVWVANRLDGTVSRIDRGHQITTIDVGGEPTGLAFGGGSLWVADGQGRRLAQVAPQSNRVVQQIPVGNAADAVTVGYGAVWVASAVDATVVRIDMRSGKAGPPIPVQARPSALAAGAGAIWVASDTTARVVRLDPRKGTPLAGIPVGNGASAVAVGAGAVWVANRSDGTVTRIDPDREVPETVPVGREPRALAIGRDAVWVADAGDGRVVRIDARSHRVTRAVDVASSPAALAVVDGTLWTAAVAPSSAHRGGTLRVDFPAVMSPGPPDSVDPVFLSAPGDLVYDGLTAYRRAGGSAGGTLVADLARELPEPSADGKTYVFRLRPHVRFSNGAPLRPEDVRASIERTLALTARDILDVGDLPIRGAQRCGVKRCDLSRGIETDAVAGTVTIHLTRPDAEFLHVLHDVFVVPGGSPVKLVTTRPLPGTGPYMFAGWTPRRGGLLVRNPHFRVWSPDRPDGFPDQIAVRDEQPRAQIAAVEHGAADVALLDSTIRGVAQLRTRYGARLHTDPAAQTSYVFLNVLAPPFDDVRVRRALNYAVDRGRVAELAGGSVTQHSTCQLLPPGFQGYTPSCPFTVNPSSAGVWTGPDLARARRLVAASGTRGMKVEFWGARGFIHPVDRYFVSLLHELGYRSRLRTFSDLYLVAEHSAGRPRPRPQLGIWGWIADTGSPATFLQPIAACSGDTNLSRSCDAKLDALMRQGAVAGGPGAIETWRRVEARLAARAPTVPLVNADDITLVGERVGDYQHHPLDGPLLDQLWVK